MNNKTLEQLEKNSWEQAPKDVSSLVATCYELRKKKLKDFTTEDLRIMINQDMSLEYLIPLAIEVLKENPFAEGDYYEGDLLKSVLSSDTKFWNNNQNLKKQVQDIWEANFNKLQSLDTTEEIRESLLEAYQNFSGQ